MLPAVFTTILFSLSAVAANRTIRFMGGTEANFWRLALATFFLAGYAHTFGRGLGGGAFHIFLVSGLIGFGVGDLALYQALPRLGSRLTILLVHCLASPFAALTEWLWLGTTLSHIEILSSLTILIGVALALAPNEHLHLTRKIAVPGLLFGLVAAFGQGFGAVLSRKAYDVTRLAGQNVDGITAAYQRIIGGLFVAGIVLLIVKRKAIAEERSVGAEIGLSRSKHKWRSAWCWILGNALAGPTLGVSCYQWALKTTPTGIVLPIVALTPLVIIPFSRRMEGEKPSKRSLLGGIIAVLGAVALALAS